MGKFMSTKLFEGYSTCFRQWRATQSHCAYIHGYSLKFKVWFECLGLDGKSWVQDFGSFKRNGVKEHLRYMFDHTTVIAKDDPKLSIFKELEKEGLVQLRIIDQVGCEKFAEYVFNYINQIVFDESKGRVKVRKVECFEDEKNSAIFLIPSANSED